MMKHLYTLGAILIVALSHAQPWARTWGGIDADQVKSTAVAPDGSIYVVGSFEGVVDLDPGPGTVSATADGKDGFLSKFNTAGQLLWAARIGGPGLDECLAVAVDGAGNVIVSGLFRESIDLDPGPATVQLTPTATIDFAMDGFLAKYDPAGALLWGKQAGGSTSININYLQVGANNSILAGGDFNETVDFDPGPAVHPLTAGFRSVFYCQLDQNGSFMQAGKLGSGGATGNASGGDIAVDGTGNIFLSGLIYGTQDMDPGPGTYDLTSLASRSAFVCKLDPNGAFLWAHALGGEGLGVRGLIDVDAAGAVYTTGWFEGSSDFDPGPGTHVLTAVGTGGYTGDAFIQKMDGDGNFVWAKQLGGWNASLGAVMVVGPDGNIYTAGTFSAEIDMDPGTDPGDTLIFRTPTTAADGYISILSPDGDLVGAMHFSGTGAGFIQTIHPAMNGELLLSGSIFEEMDCDLGPGVDNRTSNGDLDAFLIRAALGPTAVGEITVTGSLRAYPNPSATGQFTVELPPGNAQPLVRIHDLLGQEVPCALTRQGNTLLIELWGAQGTYFMDARIGNERSRSVLVVR